MVGKGEERKTKFNLPSMCYPLVIKQQGLWRKWNPRVVSTLRSPFMKTSPQLLSIFLQLWLVFLIGGSCHNRKIHFQFFKLFVSENNFDCDIPKLNTEFGLS